ncbi:unnamed protein product [Cochlearia groenlandica]
MNHLVIIVLIIAMYIGLNQACAPNRVTLINALTSDAEGNDRPLQYHCRGIKGQDTGSQSLKLSGDERKFVFASSNLERGTLSCNLSFGKGSSFDNLIVYQGNHCGQVAIWVFRNDGIFFRSSEKAELQQKFSWKRA